MSDSFPKVLVAAPTASIKRYCFADWLENCMNFDYPNYNVRLFDNTQDNGEYMDAMGKMYAERFGYNDDFAAYHSFQTIKGIGKMPKDIKDRMAKSHNDCRNQALEHGYDYLLHLESDIFPPSDVIERLMHNRKKVCGALYYTDEGIHRRLMVQRKVNKSPNNIMVQNFEPQDDVHFIDGTVKKVPAVGLGCILIHRSVLEKIEFRNSKDYDAFPDSFFAEDCGRNRIPIFADTSIICEHRNQSWDLIT